MDTKDIPITEAPSDWQPITNKHDLAVLGKLGEEVGELSAAIFRCVIQGINEQEPRTHKINKQWLQDEIADAMAMQIIAVSRLGLDLQAILDRRDRKMAYKQPWFDSLARQEQHGLYVKQVDDAQARALLKQVDAAYAEIKASLGVAEVPVVPEWPAPKTDAEIKADLAVGIAAMYPSTSAGRSPTDGSPYYCTYCGSGFSEYLACLKMSCALESHEVARERRNVAGLKSRREQLARDPEQ